MSPGDIAGQSDSIKLVKERFQIVVKFASAICESLTAELPILQSAGV
jgi:hypothetical protein